MSMQSGGITFRLFRRERANDEDLIERMAKHALPPLDSLKDGSISGWVTGRHALDRNLTIQTALYGSHLRVGLTQAERKVPAALLKAECRMEELAQMQASGGDRVSLQTRIEIRRSVAERLQATTPPTLNTIEVVSPPGSSRLWATCASDRQMDALTIAWVIAGGGPMIPLRMESLCPKLKDAGGYAIPLGKDTDDRNQGADFLTWFWFYCEARGGLIKIAGQGDWAMMLEGPLLMTGDGQGSHETLMRKGEPLLGAEAKAALLDGKKLRRAKITLARGDQSYSFTFDAETFTFRSMKLPAQEKLDPVSAFQERMANLEHFCDAFLMIVNTYEAERLGSQWPQTLTAIREWANQRRVR